MAQDPETTRARRLEAIDGLPLLTADREHIVSYASIGLAHAINFDILPIPDFLRPLRRQ